MAGAGSGAAKGDGEAASFVKFTEGSGADSDSDGERAPMATLLEAVFCKFFCFFSYPIQDREAVGVALRALSCP